MKDYTDSIKTACKTVEGDRFLNSISKNEVTQDLLDMLEELEDARKKAKKK